MILQGGNVIKDREIIEAYLEALEPVTIFYSKKYRIQGLDWKDVAQEVRIHLWRKLKHYDVTRSSIKTWATKVIKNKIIDLSRKKKDLIDYAIPLEWDEAEDELDNNLDDDFVYLNDDL